MLYLRPEDNPKTTYCSILYRDAQIFLNFWLPMSDPNLYGTSYLKVRSSEIFEFSCISDLAVVICAPLILWFIQQEHHNHGV
jgi:hypothetical protein